MTAFWMDNFELEALKKFRNNTKIDLLVFDHENDKIIQTLPNSHVIFIMQIVVRNVRIVLMATDNRVQ